MTSTLAPVQPLRRPAHYYFSPCYREGQPRVLLMVGTAWRPQLRAHYGIRCEPFFSREAYSGEPDHYPNRHPWGWVFAPEAVLSYERDSRQLSTASLQHLASLLQQQIAAVPFAPESAQAIALAARAPARARLRLTEIHA